MILLAIIILSIDNVNSKFSIDNYQDKKIDGIMSSQNTHLKNGPITEFSFMQIKDSDKKFEDIEDFVQKKVCFYIFSRLIFCIIL